MRIREGNTDDMRVIYYDRYVNDFPLAERKPLSEILSLMNTQRYKLLTYADEDGIVAYALVFTIDSYKYLWIDYLAVHPEHRDLGYGSSFLSDISSYFDDCKLILMEVEIADSLDKDTFIEQRRRIQFYERAGAVRLPFLYKFPTNEYKKFIPMHLYIHRIKSGCISGSGIIGAIYQVYKFIHRDIPHAADLISEEYKSDIVNAVHRLQSKD